MDLEIQEAYQRVLENYQEEITFSDSMAGPEKRQFPRFKVKTSNLWISSLPEFSVADLSANGIALLSNHPVEAGKLLTLSEGKMLSVESKVVACTLEMDASGQFRIRCLFLEELKGMELLVYLL